MVRRGDLIELEREHFKYNKKVMLGYTLYGNLSRPDFKETNPLFQLNNRKYCY